MRRPLTLLLVLALALTGCGSDDDSSDGASGGGGTGESSEQADSSGEQPVPAVSSCTFVPNETEAIGAGHVTVEGRNDTGAVIDSTGIDYTLTDEAGQEITSGYTAISHWAVDEEVAYRSPVLHDEAIPVADCEITEVTPGAYAERTTFDAEEATCEVVVEEGQLASTEARVDISGVADAPDDAEIYAIGAVYTDGRRVTEINRTLDPGATTFEERLVDHEGDLTCRVLELRLP